MTTASLQRAGVLMAVVALLGGSAIKNGRQVDFVVKVRYAKTTDDGRYEAPGAKGKAGVVTAYCRGMQKCPSWVN
ncbi:hypothetical protein [Streptomyces antimicrobicus]|uniref:Uncharacterized protein n=1 Tax=Streptomyces antimicrobicus TaxID=2883108 RepID=A0ABS8B7S8_9ACTN|nr:hypothetical protein [Streptomyces antimicrobicus]MCB5180681.1 hypothetical protein [Streptomyces antimicrobicus]